MTRKLDVAWDRKRLDALPVTTLLQCMSGDCCRSFGRLHRVRNRDGRDESGLPAWQLQTYAWLTQTLALTRVAGSVKPREGLPLTTVQLNT